MADFNYIGWGSSFVGKWVLETGESGIYRGQCTQAVSQLLKSLGYTGWRAARGNGNQVGPYMVAHGEAVYVGTNLASVPSGEIHIVCQEVGNALTAGHVSVCAAVDVIYEQNVSVGGLPIRNYGAGPVRPMRLGRLSEGFRTTRFHYKLTVASDYDNISGDGSPGDPIGDPTGPNQNRFLRNKQIITKKFKSNKLSSIENRKRFQLVAVTRRDVNQG